MENRGATTRVFLDSVETAPNNLYSRSYADSTGHDATFIAYLAYFDPANGLLNYYDPLTLLLLGRSIGLTYDAQYSLDAANNPVSGLQYYPPASLLFYGTQAPWISEHDRDALNLTAKYRRGFIGEYQFDIPENLSVKILDTVGNPMPNQKVDVFQTAIAGGLTTEPIFSGTTDAAGVLALPNRAVSRRDTPTGHKLKPNPFGQVDPYGRNGLLHFRVKTPIRYNFAWLPLSRVNTAFWKGATKKATLPIVAYRYSTGIAPVPTKQEVTVDAGKTYNGVFTINTGVIKSQVAASVVQGQNYLTIAKPEGVAPYRVKYTVDATTLAKGTYDAYILLHDWSQGTNDYLFYVKVTVQ